jgi:hypothetical protein
VQRERIARADVTQHDGEGGDCCSAPSLTSSQTKGPGTVQPSLLLRPSVLGASTSHSALFAACCGGRVTGRPSSHTGICRTTLGATKRGRESGMLRWGAGHGAQGGLGLQCHQVAQRKRDECICSVWWKGRLAVGHSAHPALPLARGVPMNLSPLSVSPKRVRDSEKCQRNGDCQGGRVTSYRAQTEAGDRGWDLTVGGRRPRGGGAQSSVSHHPSSQYPRTGHSRLQHGKYSRQPSRGFTPNARPAKPASSASANPLIHIRLAPASFATVASLPA